MKKVFLFLWIILLTGCFQSAPEKDDFETPECYVFINCMYRNQKNIDKSICAVLGEACRDSLKEKRVYERIKYCGEVKLKWMTPRECILMINQK